VLLWVANINLAIKEESNKMSTYYKDIQIVKHALQFYITRPNANEKDLEKEKKLLKKVENEVSNFKKSNHIK
jgi:hypothetical protein